VAEQLVVTTANLLLQAEIQRLAEPLPVVAVVVAFGTVPAKLVRAARVVAQAHQVQTVIDIVYLVATEPQVKAIQEVLVVDSIVKATINTPAAVEVEQAVQEWMPVMKDMNILHQTVVLG
jgi:hypothetical protein